MPVQDDRPPRESHLFTMRFWPEAVGAGEVEWRGKVSHVPGGECRYFRDWETLLGFLQAVLNEKEEERNG